MKFTKSNDGKMRADVKVKVRLTLSEINRLKETIHYQGHKPPTDKDLKDFLYSLLTGAIYERFEETEDI